MKSKSVVFIVSLVLLLTVSTGTVFGQKRQFRNIASARFDYYSDKRYGLVWEEVFIAPLPAGFFLVTAVNGENTSFSDITGGKLGLAFDLPGYFYGEGSYSLEYTWDDSSLIHTAFLSLTYESGPAMASANLTGEFTNTSTGGVFAPGIQYFVTPELALAGRIFLAFHHYEPSSDFFNFAFLGIGEYALSREIWLSLGGTYGSVYEPATEYEKWSIIGGVKVVPSDNLVIRSQFEYTNGLNHPTNPHQIYSIVVVLDLKFGKRE